MEDKGCAPSSSEEGYLKFREKTHHLNLEIEGESNDSHTINVSSLSTASLFCNLCKGTQTNKPTTSSLMRSIFSKIFHRPPIVNNNNIIIDNITVYPTTLEAKAMLTVGLAALVGLLSVTYKVNGHGNLVPTALFHQPTFSFTFFITIIMTIFYFAAIGMLLEEAFPKITKVLNVISFVCLVLGVTVLLWALIPSKVCWIPWILFACTVAVVFGVLVYGRLTDKSYTLRCTVSLDV